MTGDNDATGTILHVGSKSGGLAHGRGRMRVSGANLAVWRTGAARWRPS